MGDEIAYERALTAARKIDAEHPVAVRVGEHAGEYIVRVYARTSDHARGVPLTVDGVKVVVAVIGDTRALTTGGEG